MAAVGGTGRLTRAVLGLGVVVMLVAGCTDDGEPAASTPPTTASPETAYPEDIAAACAAHDAAFDEFVADMSMTDDEHAEALEAIAADEAAGTRLEPLILETAQAYRRGDSSIPSQIGTMCSGRTTTTLGGPQRADRERFLDEVRAAEPAIEDGDNDLIESISAACDLLKIGDAPENREQLLATAWAPLQELEHAEPVLRVGVPIFCPEHASTVDSILGSSDSAGEAGS